MRRRTTARRTPSTRWLTVPAVAAAAALVVIPNTGDGDGADTQPPQAGPATIDPDPQMVTETIRMAGFTLTYEREAGAPNPVFLVVGGEMTVPDDFREVEVDGPVRAWAGVDATSGDARVYMWHPADQEGPGGLAAITSPTWSQDQLVDLVRDGISG